MNVGRGTNLLRAALIGAALLCALPAQAQAQAVAQASAGQPSAGPSDERRRMNGRVFDRVWTEVRRDYFDPNLNGVDWDAARERFRPQALEATNDAQLYAAVNAMLALLDDAHAQASSPASRRRIEAQGRERPVLGVTLARAEGGGFTVTAVREGSAAEAAGVRTGWRLLVQDGGWTPDDDVVADRAVRLSFLDEAGARRDFDLMPRIMPPVPTFVADRSRPGVLVLRVRAFDPGLGRWLGAELANLSPDVDVVLDLRGNPGGRLYEAEAALGCFLPRAVPWAWRAGRDQARRLMVTSAPCGQLEAPIDNDLAVLIDGASRSAAELTPAALQESGRALVVGVASPGAVLISADTDLPDGGKLTLSRADFITVSGVRLEKRGVTPDVAVQSAEAALDAAIAALAPASETAGLGSAPN